MIFFSGAKAQDLGRRIARLKPCASTEVQSASEAGPAKYGEENEQPECYFSSSGAKAQGLGRVYRTAEAVRLHGGAMKPCASTVVRSASEAGRRKYREENEQAECSSSGAEAQGFVGRLYRTAEAVRLHGGAMKPCASTVVQSSSEAGPTKYGEENEQPECYFSSSGAKAQGLGRVYRTAEAVRLHGGAIGIGAGAMKYGEESEQPECSFSGAKAQHLGRRIARLKPCASTRVQSASGAGRTEYWEENEQAQCSFSSSGTKAQHLGRLIARLKPCASTGVQSASGAGPAKYGEENEQPECYFSSSGAKAQHLGRRIARLKPCASTGVR